MSVHLHSRVLGIALLAADFIANGQTPFRMKYLDEVGHLGGLDKRTTVNLGIAKVSVEAEGDLRFEGRDAGGKPWRVWMTPSAGVGATEVWTADFDHNGRPDLLISARFPGNGRCIDRTTLITLMFDRQGRPVPWMMESNSAVGYGRPPVALVDLNHDGRAEMVTASCEYSEPQAGFFEDRRVSGVYEARDARWRPVRDASARLYLAAAKRHYGPMPPGFERWLPTDPARWPDFMAGDESKPATQIKSLVTSMIGCGGVHFSIVDGAVVMDDPGPCASLRDNRVIYSDGRARRAWPYVVIDRPEGRDVYLIDNIWPVLVDLLTRGRRFKILGDPDSPSLLWVDSTAGGDPTTQVSSRLKTLVPIRMPLTAAKSLPEGLDLEDITFTLEQRCFVLRSVGADSPRVVESPDCSAIAKIRNRGPEGGPIRVRSLMAWQLIPGENVLRTWNLSNDTFQDVRFENAAGSPGTIEAAASFPDGWLVQWHSGSRQWLVYHSASGKPLTGEMPLPADGVLFDSESHRGVTFLRWADGKPAELIVVPAAVEWSRPSAY